MNIYYPQKEKIFKKRKTWKITADQGFQIYSWFNFVPEAVKNEKPLKLLEINDVMFLKPN